MKVFICVSFKFGPVRKKQLFGKLSVAIKPVLYRQLIVGKKIGTSVQRCSEACELNVRLQSSRSYHLLI